MSGVTFIRMDRSDAIRERFNMPEDAPWERVLGPFEFVQLTYDVLRVSPDGEEIGSIRDADWFLDDDPLPWSDMVIYGEAVTMPYIHGPWCEQPCPDCNWEEEETND